jgi:hypothetical protein
MQLLREFWKHVLHSDGVISCISNFRVVGMELIRTSWFRFVEDVETRTCLNMAASRNIIREISGIEVTSECPNRDNELCTFDFLFDIRVREQPYVNLATIQRRKFDEVKIELTPP